MSVDRREFLKLTGLGLGGLFVQPSKGKVSNSEVSESMGTLYDSTKCVGCKECQEACSERLDLLVPEVDVIELNDAPDDLSAYTWTLVKLHQEGEDETFVKVQCMHCVDPACVSACPVGALQKMETGPVVYDADKCFGCRYCMAACPFNVPKYQWDKVLPLVQKCDFCADRQAEGLEPACSKVCPTGALKFGKRSEILAEARSRLLENPGKYVDHIYGENEVGGTSKLYLSPIAFEKLGLPEFDSKALPDLTWPWMMGIPGIVVGVGGLMSGIYWVSKRRIENQKEEE
jgi:formate dehydrogenase iron-sulfur subunit